MSKVATLSPHGETTERLIRPVSAPPQTHSSPMTSLIDKKLLYEAWPRKSAPVVEELIMTEKSYVDALSDIITGYLKPLYEFLLQESQGPQFIEIVFCNIRKIHDIHVHLVNSFLLVYSEPKQFASVFDKNASQFKEYIQYCTNFPHCEHTLQQTLKNSPSTQEFILQCQLKLGHPLPLITYLHRPVQRILKYKLLLEQILKGFTENTESYDEIKRSVAIMSDVAEEINDVKKKQENMKRVESIQKSLKGLKGTELSSGDLQSYGHLLLEETCKAHGRRGGDRVILLFEKMLLFLKKKGDNSFGFKGVIMIEELDLLDQPHKKNVVKLFSMYTPSKIFLVELRSQRVKEEFIESVQSLLWKQMKKQGNKKIEIIEDAPNKKEEKSDSDQSFNVNKRPRMETAGLIRQRSLEAKELQRRRQTRQMSTRRSPRPHSTYVSKHEERMEISIGMTESHVNDNQSLIQLTNDSGIGLSIVSNNDSELTQHVEEESKQDEESEESPRLRRKTAFRRKKLRSTSIPEQNLSKSSSEVSDIAFSLPVTSPLESWQVSNAPQNDVVSTYEISEDTISLDTGNRLETSLDKGGIRGPSFTEQSTEEVFIFDTQEKCQIEPVLRRRRSDTFSAPPDPFQLLNRDNVLSGASISKIKEEEEMTVYTRDRNESSPSKEASPHRQTVSSCHLEDSMESLGSSASSLGLEDHYLLSRTAGSAIIASNDGENIIIYDDTDDSESELEEEEEEEISEIWQDDPPSFEEDIVQSSLRSYLNMAKLNSPNSFFDETEISASPLATLPRGCGPVKGVPSPLVYQTRLKLQKQNSLHVMQSLPPVNSPALLHQTDDLSPDTLNPSELNHSLSMVSTSMDALDRIQTTHPKEDSFTSTELNIITPLNDPSNRSLSLDKPLISDRVNESLEIETSTPINPHTYHDLSSAEWDLSENVTKVVSPETFSLSSNGTKISEMSVSETNPLHVNKVSLSSLSRKSTDSGFVNADISDISNLIDTYGEVEPTYKRDNTNMSPPQPVIEEIVCFDTMALESFGESPKTLPFSDQLPAEQDHLFHQSSSSKNELSSTTLPSFNFSSGQDHSPTLNEHAPLHRRSASVPPTFPIESYSTKRPQFRHSTPSPQHVSHSKMQEHIVIDMNALLESSQPLKVFQEDSKSDEHYTNHNEHHTELPLVSEMITENIIRPRGTISSVKRPDFSSSVLPIYHTDNEKKPSQNKEKKRLSQILRDSIKDVEIATSVKLILGVVANFIPSLTHNVLLCLVVLLVFCLFIFFYFTPYFRNIPSRDMP